MGFILRDATVSSARVRALLCGPTKSGKTFDALIIARDLIASLRTLNRLKGNGTIALIDSEHDRAGMWYADIVKFKTLDLPDFKPQTYIAALNYVVSTDPSVIIIDQISHEWAGEGGLLDQHTARVNETKSGNSWAEWRNSTPMHNRFIDSLNQCPTHLICTTRAKQEWDQETDENGRKKPVKLGLGPEQRKDVEYEFDIFGMIDQNHSLTIESRGRLSTKLSGRTWKSGPTVDNPGEIGLIGEIIAGWIAESTDNINTSRLSIDQIDELKFIASSLNIGEKGWKKICEDWKVDDITSFSPKQHAALLAKFRKDLESSTSDKKERKSVKV